MAQIGGANSNETGGYYNSIAGDQKDGREVAITGWFNGNVRNEYWINLVTVARFWDEDKRDKIVAAMTAACENNHIGYDRGNRGTLRDELVRLGGVSLENIKRIRKNCDTDCSALVSVCIQAACGVNFGNWDTASMTQELQRYRELFQFLRIKKGMQETGKGLLPGDILVWRNESIRQGHTAVVITTDDSYVSEDAYGNYGLVITPSEEDAKSWERRFETIGARTNLASYMVYGEDHNYDLDNSYGLLDVAWLDDNNEIRYASKCVYVPHYGQRYITIFGDEETDPTSVFVGDSRVIQLGSNILPESDANYSKQYGLIPDNCIFAKWGGTLLSQMTAARLATTNNAMGNAKKAAGANALQAYFWLGINDIQIFKENFLYPDPTEPSGYSINYEFCAEWVNIYKSLINQYKSSYEKFDEKVNKVCVLQIVSTSTREKDYYQLQGDVIDVVNRLLYEWVESVKQQYPNPNDSWLQYIWLDDRHATQTSQQFVKDRDFVDRIHFTKDWFLKNLFTHIDFTGIAGEKD